ncbi:MAG: dihydrolipoyl dehydrogenase [Rickettsiales bacterium]
MKEFDVVILGGGPGGYVAAIRAGQLGLKTAVIERDTLGGICLNWGCIPTKALLRSAEVLHLVQNADEFGVKCSNISFDLKKMVERSRSVSKKLTTGIKQLMKKNNITVIEGTGKLLGNSKIQVGSEEIKAKHIVIATGARAREIKGIEPDGKYIWTYKEAMIPAELPKSLLIVGSGAIGIEFASFYNMLGVEVTIAEISHRILGAEDEEISKIAHKAFEKRGINIITEAAIANVKIASGLVEVEISSKKYKFERVISAVGIVPNVENIGLEKTKVKLDEKGHIKTDQYSKTDEPNVYAIGDVTKGPWLAHKASHEGVICIEKIAGSKGVQPIKQENIPGCTYCYPQIASVGLTEDKAKLAGYKIKVGRFPFMANGKAIALGEPEGLVKTIFDEKTGELLGAHMIGAEVTEMIQGFVIGKTMEATEEEFMHTIFPHPTLSEMMHESVLSAFGKALHF